MLVEAEPIPGLHASGRNAAMVRRVIEDPLMTHLATWSVALIDALEVDEGLTLRDRRGGLLLGDAAAIDTLAAAAEAAPRRPEGLERLSRGALTRRWPVLDGASAEAGLFSPTCGVSDIHALLTAYLAVARRGGARVRYGARVTAVDLAGGRVQGVQTTTGPLACDALVVAAGFAADAIARLAGAAPLPLTPVRRHLHATAAFEAPHHGWPFVWDVTHGLYFRPEGPGFVLCACDETAWPCERWPEDSTRFPTVDPTERERLADKFSRHVPALAGVRPTRSWAGLRTMTPDGRFIVGRDPTLAGLAWVVGLGGHGMTTSAAVGELGADVVTRGAPAAPFDAAFSPARF